MAVALAHAAPAPSRALLAGMADSIAVLDAYFAFCDGDRARMREAARRVDVATDDDLEDLYLVQLALDGAGDTAAASAPHARGPPPSMMTPIILGWLAADASGDPRAVSPRQPGAALR
jgi:hypothetical protein